MSAETPVAVLITHGHPPDASEAVTAAAQAAAAASWRLVATGAEPEKHGARRAGDRGGG